MWTNIKVGIYCIENITTGKKYIGQSKNIDDRWSKHKHELKNNKHDNSYLQNAWNKYGNNDFKFYILECCKDTELDAKENYYIDIYNTLNRDCGYNLKSGGQNGGSVYSEEIRKRMSESVKSSYDNELKEKRRNDALQQWSDPEIKKKITGSNNGMYGKKHTDDTKRKISEKNKGKTYTRRKDNTVRCVELNKIFNSPTMAANELSLNAYNIMAVCKGRRQTCGGFHWKYENIIGE